MDPEDEEVTDIGQVTFGLDYGPAPGQGLPRLPKGTVKATMQAKAPTEPEDKLAALVQPPAPQEDNLTGLIKNPGNPFGDTPTGVLQDFVANRGYKVGEALDKLKELYSADNPYVRGLPGIDEFINRIPGTGSLTVDKFWDSMGAITAPALRGVNTLARLGAADSKEDFIPHVPSAEQQDFMQRLKDEVRPSDWKSDLLGFAPKLGAFEAGATIAAPLAEAATGSALLQGLLRTAAGSVGLSAAEGFGGDPKHVAEDVGLNVALDLGLHGVGKALKPLGRLLKNTVWPLGSVDRPVVDKALGLIAEKSGISPEQLGARVQTLNDLVEGLHAIDAPEELTQRVVKEGAARFKGEFGEWYGKTVAERGHTPEELDNLLGVFTKDYPEFGQAARRSYLERLGVETPERASFYTKPGEVSAPRTIEARVVDRPYAIGGAAKYYPQYSKWHLDSSKQGPVSIVKKVFSNPVEVVVGDGQIPSYALISSLKGNPRLVAATLQALEYKTSKAEIPFSRMANVTEAIANRLAKSMGYDSILYKHPNFAQNSFVDLTNVKPLDSKAERIVNEFEKSLAREGRKALGQNFLSVAIPVVGAGAAIVTAQDQAQGAEIPVEGLAQLAKVGKGGLRRFLEGFTELITPESKAIRPPVEVDYRSPLFNPLSGRPPVGHDELAVDLLSGADKADLVGAGYVRALREDNNLGLEFNPEHEVAVKNALDFLRREFRLGDNVRIDRGSQSGEFFLPGQAAQFIRKGHVPSVGVGLGELAAQGESRAAELGSLVTAASKFDSLGDMLAEVDPKLGNILKQVSVMTGLEKPGDVVQALLKVRDDVHSLSGDARVEPFNISPDYVGVNITHPTLGGFPLATINGVIDAHSGTWYPQVKTSPLGLGKKALREVFRQVKGVSPYIKKLGMPNSIGGLLAATWIGKEVYDLVSPSEASAAEIPTKPILEMLAKGLRGAGESALEDVARSKSIDDLMAATISRVKNVQAKGAEGLESLSTGEHSFISFPAMADLTPEALQLIGSATRGESVNSLSEIRPPYSKTEDPVYQSWYNYLVNQSGDMFRGENSTKGQAQKRAYELAKDLGEDDKIELTRALYGLRPNGDGTYLQTEAGVPEHVGKVAETLSREILDKFDQLLTGVDSKAVGIMRQLGLEESQRNWKLIDAIQKSPEALPNGADERHVLAAQQMVGMLNIKPYQWKNLSTPYAQRHFIISPIKQERQALVEQLSKFDAYGPELPPDVQALRQNIVDRLKTLNQRESGRFKPSREQLRDKFFAPLAEENIPEIGREKDPLRLLLEHIDGATARAFFDHQNHLASTVAGYFRDRGDAQMADYIPDLMNTLNGAKGLGEDITLHRAVNGVFKLTGSSYRVPLETVKQAFRAVQEFTYIAKLASGVRFALLVNPTQPLQTTSMVTGFLSIFRAVAKLLNDPDIWKEAAAQRVYKIGHSRELAEIEAGYSPNKLRKGFDFLTNKSEEWNRVLAYAAGKDWVLDQYAKTGKVSVPHFVRGFDRTVLGSGDVEKIAREVGKAISLTTNFIMGPEGRPLVLSGGVARQTATQFKSFTAAYVDLLMGAVKHGKITGDWGPITRGVTSLMLLGGVGTILPYEIVRRELIKRGHDWLPAPSSGIGAMMSIAASTFSSPDTRQQIQDAANAVQVGGSYSILNMGDTTGDKLKGTVLDFLAGPSYGTALGNLGTLTGDKPPVEKAHDILRQTLPTVNSAMEASQAVGNKWLNEKFSELGYRGGLYSPTGKLHMKQPSGMQILARALNLTPSWNSQRYKHLVDIQAALEGGQNALAQTMLNRARQDGFIFTQQDFGGLKGAAKSKANKASKPNEELR